VSFQLHATVGDQGSLRRLAAAGTFRAVVQGKLFCSFKASIESVGLIFATVTCLREKSAGCVRPRPSMSLSVEYTSTDFDGHLSAPPPTSSTVIQRDARRLCPLVGL
jgi:hypothetical protein